MSPSPRAASAQRLLATLCAAAAIAFGCRTERQVAGEARLYTVRGVVRQLPAAAGVPLLIEHEAIPDLVDAEGEPAPMRGMTMPFAVSSGVDLSDLAVGDVVSLTLSVDWSAPSAVLITEIRPLPAETALEIPTRVGTGER